jgi:choice-of-anchor A domain-containing protein
MMGVRNSSQISARSAADAGLTKALLEMNQQLEAKTWNDGSLPSTTDELLPNCDSSFSYNVAKTTTADGNDLYTIACTGNSSRFHKTVKATLELKGIFEYAIYVAGNITLKNGTTISAYNNKAGDHPLQIGTNSTDTGAVTAKTGVTIDGDIVIGVGGDTDTVIDNKAEAAITGKSYPSLIKNKTPAIKVPKYLLDMASSGALTGSSTISTSVKYDSINLKGVVDPNKSDIITIDAKNVEIYVIGDLILGNGDELQILPGASLTIYLGGSLFVDNSGSINNLTTDAKQLKVYGLDTCTNIDFKNSSDFYGAIYAPNADIRLHNGVQVYGAMVGKSFLQDVSGNFHYDMSLREVDPTEIGVHMVIKRWSE